MKLIRIDDRKDFGLVMTDKGIDGYLTNNEEVLSGVIGPNFFIATTGRMVLTNGDNTTVKMGPFLLPSDGKTPVSELAIAQGDVLIAKNDQGFAAKNHTGSAVEDSGGPGWYDVPFDSVDTNTQGNLLIYINKAGALPVWRMVEVGEAVVV